LFTDFDQIWQVDAATNAEQCVLKLPTSPGVCTHTTVQYLKNTVISHNFQQNSLMI